MGANVARGEPRPAQHVAVLGPQRPRHGLRGRRNVLHIDDGHLTAAGQRQASRRIEQLGAQAVFDFTGVQSAVEGPHRAHRLPGQNLHSVERGLLQPRPQPGDPGDPLFPLDPIFNSVRDPEVRQRMVSSFDIGLTVPDWALGFRWDVVLRGRDATPMLP